MIAFSPHPELVLGALHLSTHGLLIAAGFLVATVLGRQAAKQRGLNADIVDNAALIGVIAGLIGARIVFILTLGRALSFVEMLRVWEGGLSSHGGYLFGIVAALLYVRAKKASVLAYADVLMPYLLVGWAIGRIGCLLNWDSFGRVTDVPWALVVFGVPHHATQLYESLGYLLGFCILSKITRPLRLRESPGTAAAAALGLFALTRFVVDFFRADVPGYLLFSRVLTGAIIVGAVVFLILRTRRQTVVK